MSRKFIAAGLAVSTTLATCSAAPARAASEEDIARILGAAATLFIIGKAIESSRDKDRKDKKAKKKAKSHYHPPKVYSHTPRTYSHKPIPKVVPRHVQPHRGHLAALPARCVRRIEGGHVRRVVMGRCLERHYRSARELPRKCRMRVETPRGERRAYALPCLRHRGYTLARN